MPLADHRLLQVDNPLLNDHTNHSATPRMHHFRTTRLDEVLESDMVLFRTLISLLSFELTFRGFT